MRDFDFDGSDIDTEESAKPSCLRWVRVFVCSPVRGAAPSSFGNEDGVFA